MEALGRALGKAYRRYASAISARAQGWFGETRGGVNIRRRFTPVAGLQAILNLRDGALRLIWQRRRRERQRHNALLNQKVAKRCFGLAFGLLKAAVAGHGTIFRSKA